MVSSQPSSSSSTTASLPVVGTELFGTVPLAGLVLMLVNDHWLRVAYPGWTTGKLSDVGVMMFMPFLLSATWCWVCAARNWMTRKQSRRACSLNTRLLTVTHLLAGAALAGINLSPHCRDLYLATLNRLDPWGAMGPFRYTLDPSDCLALLVLPFTWWWGKVYLVSRRRHEDGGV